MKLMMYKGGGTFFDECVRLRTGSEYSHCELTLHGVSYSSSLRDPERGVRSKVIYFDPETWDTYELKEDTSLEARLLETFERTRGMRYDWKGILIGQVFGTRACHPGRRYCSAWCGEVLLNYRHFSPAGLLRATLQAGLLA